LRAIKPHLMPVFPITKVVVAQMHLLITDSLEHMHSIKLQQWMWYDSIISWTLYN
jgi:hypothetical protein